MQFQVNACLFYNITKNLLHALLLGMLWNVTLIMEAKALEDVVGIGHLALSGTDSFALGFGICGLTASALWRIPLGAMTSVTF